MTGHTGFGRLESRISSGLAEVFASSNEDPFPEVPRHSWADTAERPPSGAQDPSVQMPMSFPDSHISRTDRDIDNVVDDGPRDDLYEDTRVVSSPSSAHVSREGVLPSSTFEPWSYPDPWNRHGATSTETLRNADNDEWFNLEQIAGYLDMHQKSPITAHTGFNYVEGTEAARNLGIPDLNGDQMMLLMRAGLILHHYASSPTPWRDALGVVQYRMEREAGIETNYELAHHQYAHKRLMKQLSDALSYRDKSILLKFMRLWHLNLLGARECSARLLMFDEQTLLSPYFNNWKAQKDLVAVRTQNSAAINTRQMMQSALRISRTALTKHRAINGDATAYYKKSMRQHLFGDWLMRMAGLLNNSRSADEYLSLSLLTNSFKRWRRIRRRIALEDRFQSEQIASALKRWRHALGTNRAREHQSVVARSKLLFQECRVEFLKRQQNESHCAEVAVSVQRNQISHILRQAWLSSKTRNASEAIESGRHHRTVRVWRAETRLSCYGRIKSRDIASDYFNLWQKALGSVEKAHALTARILETETSELERTLLMMLRTKRSDVSAYLEPRMNLATSMVAGRCALRLMKNANIQIRDLENKSEHFYVHSVMRSLVLESSRRKESRLSRFTDSASSLVLRRRVKTLLSNWRLRAQAQTLEITRIERASMYGDCVFAANRWFEALDDKKELEAMAEYHFMKLAIVNGLTKWRTTMENQIEAEITAQKQLTLRKGLTAKRILRSWRRQHTYVLVKVSEWHEDAHRQLALIYFRTLKRELHRRRRSSARDDYSEHEDLLSSSQSTPSRSHAISPRALDLWSGQKTAGRNATLPADDWGATPLSRRLRSSPRMLSTPTKPARMLRSLKLDPDDKLS